MKVLTLENKYCKEKDKIIITDCLVVDQENLKRLLLDGEVKTKDLEGHVGGSLG